MTPVERVLTSARDLIAKENRWTQGALAHDDQGKDIAPESDNARCFCILGALRRVAMQIGNDDAKFHAQKILKKVCGSDLISFNDSHGHKDVVRVFDRAIAQVAA